MLEEGVRRSSRRNKGTNKYLQDQRTAELEYVKARAKKREVEADDREISDSVRCLVCGTTDENYDEDNDPHGDMIQCDKCYTWQHIKCMIGQEEADKIGTYYCSICAPSSYPNLKYSIDSQAVKKSHAIKTSEPDDELEDFQKDLSDESANEKLEEDFVRPTKRRKHNGRKNVTTNSTRNQGFRLRDSALKMFRDLFAKYVIPDTVQARRFQPPSQLSCEQYANTLATELEEELYATNVGQEESKFNEVYKEKVRVLFSNLKDQKNIDMKALVVNRALPFNKLVKMSVNELVNPDLRSFKEKVGSEALTQLILEQPHKPRYFKTHKGEELIEDPNDYEPEDMIFNKDILITKRGASPENSLDETPNETSVKVTPVQTSQESDQIYDGSSLDGDENTWKCTMDYKELDCKFSGSVEFIGSSQEMSYTIQRDAVGDSTFVVEGRLSGEEAEKYIRQMASSRAFLVYAIKPGDSSQVDAFEHMFDFLSSRQRYGALVSKRQYVRHVYVIPKTETLQSEVFNFLALNEIEHNLKNQKCLFVVLILRLDMLDLK
ncbi:LAQU0S01e10528g1_1 [Lachancea quebecensis]|uniref:Transcription factor BYE1 n=1 Tax=Lachancea quebecensis TaxID=1654605 RepID=A0A0P1KMA5_9SACH|nr:LAQU0S01e10528g1_1 [Lachancea quebecensis]